MKHKAILLALSIWVLTVLACGMGGASTRRNNEVRRAALAYELSTHGAVDEVWVSFGLTEVRANLGFEGGNTVWLNRFAVDEYVRTRDKARTYLYLHDLDYADDTVSIVVDRGGQDGVQSYKLTLRREGQGWEVTAEEPLETSAPPSD